MEAELLNFHHANVIYLRTLNESFVDEVKGCHQALQTIEEILIKRQLESARGNDDNVMIVVESPRNATGKSTTEKLETTTELEHSSAVNKKTKRTKNKRKKKKQTKAYNVEVAEQRDIEIKTFAHVFVENIISKSLEEVKEEVTEQLEIQIERVTEDLVKKTISDSLAEISVELAALTNDYENHLCEPQDPADNKETVLELVQKPVEHNLSEPEDLTVVKQVQTHEDEQIMILQKQLSERDATIKNQQYELDSTCEELCDAKSLISDLQNQLLEKDNFIIELKAQRDKDEGHYKAWIDELNQELHENISAFNQVNQKLEEKNVTIDQLNGELDGLKSELQGYKLREQDMKKNLEEARHLVQSLQRENQEEMEEKNGTIDQLNGQLDDLKSELQGYKLREQDMKKNLEEARHFVQSMQTENQEELEEKNATIDQLNGELDDLKSELQGYKLREQDMRKNLVEAEHLVQSLQRENQEEMEEKNAAIDQLNGELDDLKSELQGYKLRAQDTKKNLEEAEHLVQSLQTENQEEMEEKNGTIDQLNGELDDLKSELQGYKLREQDVKKNLEEAQNLVLRLNKEHQDDFNPMNRQHIAELENLRLVTSKQLGDQRQEMDEQTQVNRSEVNNLKESLDKQITRNRDLKQQLRRLTLDLDNSVARLRRKDATSEKLKSQLKQLEESSYSDIRSLRNELKDRDKEIADLVDKLSMFEGQLVLQLRSTWLNYEKEFDNEKAHMESHYKEVMQEFLDKIKRLESESKTLQSIHAQEIEVLRGDLAQYTSGLKCHMRELQSKTKKEYKDEVLAFVAQMRQEKEQLKKDLLHESEGKISFVQEALLCKIAKAEDENVLLRNKLAGLDKDLSKVTEERDLFYDEIEVLRDTHRMLEETIALLEQSISPVSKQGVYEGPLPVQESGGMDNLPGAGVNNGALNKTDLTCKLNQLRESVRQKNDLELKLGQDLVEIKTELEKERETFRAELNERRTQRRALENSNQELEAQLTEANKDNRELLREISILQKNKKSTFLRRWFKCLRKQDN